MRLLTARLGCKAVTWPRREQPHVWTQSRNTRLSSRIVDIRSLQHDCADCPGTFLCGQKRAYFNELRTAADEDGMEADRKLTDTKILERSIRFMQKYENNDKVDEPSGSDTHGVYTHMCELIAKVYDESYDQTRYEVKNSVYLLCCGSQRLEDTIRQIFMLSGWVYASAANGFERECNLSSCMNSCDFSFDFEQGDCKTHRGTS